MGIQGSQIPGYSETQNRVTQCMMSYVCVAYRQPQVDPYGPLEDVPSEGLWKSMQSAPGILGLRTRGTIVETQRFTPMSFMKGECSRIQWLLDYILLPPGPTVEGTAFRTHGATSASRPLLDHGGQEGGVSAGTQLQRCDGCSPPKHFTCGVT